MTSNTLSIVHDPKRLAALRRVALLDTPAEKGFDRLTRLTAAVLRVPMAVVSLLDENRQFFKSSVGLREPWASLRETPLTYSLCQYSTDASLPLVIADARIDPVAQDSRAVAELGVVAYADVPLVTDDGYMLGCLAVMDTMPRVWAAEELTNLTELAAVVMTEIALRTEIATCKALKAKLFKRGLAERKEAQVEHALLASIVASSYDAIVAKTLDGVILTWNQSAERLYGYTATEIIGRPFSILVPPDRAGEVSHIIDTIRLGQRMEDYETFRLRQDGTLIEVALTESPIFDSHGKITGISTIARNITERKQIERMKSEFISTVSHELRTPLTSIRGSLGLVTSGVTGLLSPQAKTMLDIAYKNSERLVELINDILDIEKIESGTMDFDKQVLELTPLVEQALAANRGYAAHFGVNYALTHAEPGILVNGNADRLTQVLNNLLWNAAKFSPANGTVEVSVVYQGTSVRVTVTDQGPGIPDEFRSRIFQKFTQADSSDSRQKGGTGLGLSIAHAIVQKHGGQIAFTTEVGVGTTFYFDLHIVQDATLAALADVDGAILIRHEVRDREERPHILHIEDDPDVVAVVSYILGSFATITSAPRLQDARRKIEQEQFELVILDMRLADGSGMDLLPLFRQRGIPVLAFSAYDIPTHVTTQVAAALVKSNTSNQSLVATVKQLLKSSEPVHGHLASI